MIPDPRTRAYDALMAAIVLHFEDDQNATITAAVALVTTLAVRAGLPRENVLRRIDRFFTVAESMAEKVKR